MSNSPLLDDDLLQNVRDARPHPPGDGLSSTGAPAQRVLERVLASTAPDSTGHRRATSPSMSPRLAGWPRAFSARRVVAAPLVVMLLIAAGVAVDAISGGSASIVSRAYAATDPTGVIVHYVEISRLLQPGGGVPSTTEIEIWTYGNQSHQIFDPNDPKSRQDVVAGGGQVQTLAYGTLIRSPFSAADNRCSAAFVLEGCVLSANNSPIAALRALSRSGQIHSAGVTTIDGRRLDVLSGRSRNLSIRALVDRHTFVPVKVTMTQTVTFPRTKGVVTNALTITNYQRLPVTASNLRRLALPPDPHVRLLHTGRN
jgi:hypothetical protein